MSRRVSLSIKIALWYGVTFFVSALLFATVVNVIFEQSYTLPPQSVKDALIAYGISPEDAENDPVIQQEIEIIRQEVLNDVRPGVRAALLAFSIVALVVGFVVSKQLLKPIKFLNKTVEHINDKALKTRINHRRQNDELGDLIDNFNTMLDRLDQSFESQKQFIDDASHELRTPLTIIKSNSEAALLRKTISKQELKEALQKNVENVDKLSTMISTLLDIAKATIDDIELTRIDTAVSLQEVIEEMKSIAQPQSITINFPVPSDSFYTLGNKILLSKVWFNLLENAIRYSNEGTAINVSLIKTDTMIRIAIADQGIGISKEKQKYIFDRFYRVDTSRSKRTGGAGLGLSIVKSILVLHKGEIRVSSRLNQGSTFIVSLPLSD